MSIWNTVRLWFKRTRSDVIDSLRRDDTFMGRFTEGECDEDEIDEEIDAWHDMFYNVSTHVSLATWLGMTDEEFSAWAEKRKTPLQILEDRDDLKES